MANAVAEVGALRTLFSGVASFGIELTFGRGRGFLPINLLFNLGMPLS